MWELKKITVDYKENPTIAPLTGIFVLPDGKIIFTSGLPNLPDGKGRWKLYHLWDMGVLQQNDGGINKIWGTSLNDLYFVGNHEIVHYNGQSWTKIKSGTELDFHDIYGATDSKTGEQQILAVCSRNLAG